jgi:hypothetical protein
LRNARRQLRFFKFGVAVEWEEEPFEWVEPRYFSVVRHYLRGPVAELRVEVELVPREGGTRLVFEVWAHPSNVLGLLAIPVEIGLMSARRFEAVFRHRQASDRADAVGLSSRVAKVGFASGGQRRLQQLVRVLHEQHGIAEDLLARLADLVERGDDLTVRFLRPYELADIWGIERREILALFLQATRGGLLEFEWDLLCPLCRGAKVTSTSLGGIASQVHCDTCNIDFEVNFDRSVELTFHPNPSIRPIETGEFCIAGPRVTPHVVAQQLLAPGEQRTLSPSLERGRYRVRTLVSRAGNSRRWAQAARRRSVWRRVRKGGPQKKSASSWTPCCTWSTRRPRNSSSSSNAWPWAIRRRPRRKSRLCKSFATSSPTRRCARASGSRWAA